MLGPVRYAISLPRRIDRVLRGLEQLGRIEDLSDSLRELRTVEITLKELSAHAASLPQLTEHAASLPQLTANAASLPELTPRVASVETMVVAIIGYLERLEPTVEQLTLAADKLGVAVGPISRIAGRLPGSKVRVLE